MTARTWEVTLNNPTDDDRARFTRICTNDGIVTRAVIAEETGSGTPHFQGRISFKQSKRLAALKKLLGTRCHFEKTKATGDWSYYFKETEPFINFDNRSQGARTDLQTIAQEIKDGATIAQIARDHPQQFIRYHSGIKALHSATTNWTQKSKYSLVQFEHEPLRLDIPIILWGESGIGKTQFALAHFKNPLVVRDTDDLRRFDSELYDGIVFDDMDFKHWPRTSQIHLLDWELSSSIRCRYENATIPAGVPRIFTTNEYGGEIFNLTDPAINRRCYRVQVDNTLFRVNDEEYEHTDVDEENEQIVE